MTDEETPTSSDDAVASVPESPEAAPEAPDTTSEPAGDPSSAKVLVEDANIDSGPEAQPSEPEPAGSEADDGDNDDDDEPVVDSPWTRPGKWFVLHTQSGYENKVRQNLEARTNSMNMESKIHEVVIPMEDVVEFKGGKKVVVQKKMFPGYLLVRCRLDDDSWYVIRNTPGVTGFVGAGNKPSPLPRRDVETFLSVKADDAEAPKRQKPRLQYELNETVRVKEGPFADFSGEVVEINEDQLKVKVLVNIFGRETPVELEFAQVAKL